MRLDSKLSAALQLTILSLAIPAALAASGCGGGSGGAQDITIDLGGGGATVSAETAEGWAEKWCRVELRMTLPQADEIMGDPTGVYQGQHQWEAYEWHFTAFANSDGTIRQLDSTEEGSTPETSSVHCGNPVGGVPDAKTRQ